MAHNWILVFLITGITSAAQPDQCLLPIDSTTHPDTVRNTTWTAQLLNRLADGGGPVAVAGSLGSLTGEALANASVPFQHELHWNWTVSDLLTNTADRGASGTGNIRDWNQSFTCQPTCALLHLGNTELCYGVQGAHETVGHLQQLVAYLREAGTTTVLVAEPSPCCTATISDLWPLLAELERENSGVIVIKSSAGDAVKSCPLDAAAAARVANQFAPYVLEHCMGITATTAPSRVVRVKTTFDIIIEISNLVLIWICIFGLSVSVDFKSFRSSLRSKGLFVGLGCQFLILPAVGFGVVSVFDLKPSYAIGLLIIVSSPGGSFSNWWCELFNADLALSVAMTTVSSLISVAMLFLNVFLYVELAFKATKGADLDMDETAGLIDMGSIFSTLGLVISSILIGLSWGAFFPHHAKYITFVAKVCGALAIMLGFFASSVSNEPPWAQTWDVYLAVISPLLIGIVIAFTICVILRLPPPQSVAVAIETAYQNTNIAIAVALASPGGADAVVIPVLYGSAEAVFFLMFCLVAWKAGWTLAPTSDPIWKVLFHNYQVTAVPPNVVMPESTPETPLNITKHSDADEPQKGSKLLAPDLLVISAPLSGQSAPKLAADGNRRSTWDDGDRRDTKHQRVRRGRRGSREKVPFDSDTSGYSSTESRGQRRGQRRRGQSRHRARSTGKKRAKGARRDRQRLETDTESPEPERRRRSRKKTKKKKKKSSKQADAELILDVLESTFGKMKKGTKSRKRSKHRRRDSASPSHHRKRSRRRRH